MRDESTNDGLDSPIGDPPIDPSLAAVFRNLRDAWIDFGEGLGVSPNLSDKTWERALLETMAAVTATREKADYATLLRNLARQLHIPVAPTDSTVRVEARVAEVHHDDVGEHTQTLARQSHGAIKGALTGLVSGALGGWRFPGLLPYKGPLVVTGGVLGFVGGWLVSRREASRAQDVMTQLLAAIVLLHEHRSQHGAEDDGEAHSLLVRYSFTQPAPRPRDLASHGPTELTDLEWLSTLVRPLTQAVLSVSASTKVFEIIWGPGVRDTLETGQAAVASGRFGGYRLIAKARDTGKIVGQGEFIRNGPLAGALLLGAVWQMAAWATGQVYLSKINKQLEDVRMRLHGLELQLHAVQEAELRAALDYFIQFYKLVVAGRLREDEHPRLEDAIEHLELASAKVWHWTQAQLSDIPLEMGSPECQPQAPKRLADAARVIDLASLTLQARLFGAVTGLALSGSARHEGRLDETHERITALVEYSNSLRSSALERVRSRRESNVYDAWREVTLKIRPTMDRLQAHSHAVREGQDRMSHDTRLELEIGDSGSAVRATVLPPTVSEAPIRQDL